MKMLAVEGDLSRPAGFAAEGGNSAPDREPSVRIYLLIVSGLREDLSSYAWHTFHGILFLRESFLNYAWHEWLQDGDAVFGVLQFFSDLVETGALE